MLKKRLLSIGVALFLLGTAISVYIGGALLPLFVVAVFVLCIFICTVHFFKLDIEKALVFALLPVIGAVYVIIYRNIFVLPFSAFDGTSDTVTADVISVSSTAHDVSVTQSSVIPVGTVIRVYSDESMTVGQRLTFTAKLRYAGDKLGLTAAGVRLYADIYDYTVNDGNGIAYSFRKSLYKTADTLPEKYSSFIKAVVFNDKSYISAERYAMYRNSGAAAFFSVSGLHISFVAITILNILRCFGVGKRTRGAAAIAAALCYGALAGFTPSVTRAVVMVAIVAAAQMISAEADGMTSLFVALGLLLLQNPFSVASVNLQLSFAATAGAIYASETFFFKNKQKPLLSALVGITVIPFVTAVSCFVFMLPFTVSSFDVVSLASLVTNIILGIIFPPLLFLAILTAIPAVFAVSVPSLLRYPLMVLINAFDSVCDFFSTAVKLILPTSTVFVSIATVFAVIAILIILTTSKKARIVSFAVCCSLVLLTISVGIAVTKRKAAHDFTMAYKQEQNAYAVLAVADGQVAYIDYGCGFDDTFIYSLGVTDASVYVVAYPSIGLYESLSYAAHCFGVKKIVLLNDESAETISEYANQLELSLEFADAYMLGSGQNGILIEDGSTTYFCGNNEFIVTNTAEFDVPEILTGIILTHSVASLPDTALLHAGHVFCANDKLVSENCRPDISKLDRGTTVRVSCRGNNIEVKVNES